MVEGGQRTLVDWESASELWPRFSDPMAHIDQLNTIAMSRALGSIVDLMTPPNQHHNTTDEMTSKTAEQLTRTIEAILRGDLYYTAMKP